MTGKIEDGEAVAKIVAIREHLRQAAIAQPRTPERDTYSDGFGNGLVYAIERIDRSFDPAKSPAPRREAGGERVTEAMVEAVADLYGNHIPGHGWIGFGPTPDAIEAALASSMLDAEPDAHNELALIDELRREEGDSVMILCDNADFNGHPNNAIIVNAGWTQWQDLRVSGHTLKGALENAVNIKKMDPSERPITAAMPDAEPVAWMLQIPEAEPIVTVDRKHVTFGRLQGWQVTQLYAAPHPGSEAHAGVVDVRSGKPWPGDDLDQLFGVLETIEYVAHNDIKAAGMKSIWDFARYAQGIAPRIRSTLVVSPSQPTAKDAEIERADIAEALHKIAEALHKMVALYESEYDADAPFVRPDWLTAALSSMRVEGQPE